MIGLCTDSNAQLPPELVERYDVEVVPMMVTIDGDVFSEGVDLDADGFYARFASDGPAPQVATSQPSPGRFAEAYRNLADRGATEILSIHITESMSGTLNAARLAARQAPVPVRLVDSGTASFGIGCCVWEAAEAVTTGATADEAATVAEGIAATVGNVFLLQAVELAAAGGRVKIDRERGDGIPVLSLVGGEIEHVGAAADLDQAADLMAARARAHGEALRVAIGIADASATPVWHALEDRLHGAPEVKEMVRYRIGPSVGVHTGPGTAGAFFYPAR